MLLVLVAVSVILLISLQISDRVVREARVAGTRASSEQAFAVAEAGFDKIRAQITTQQKPNDAYLQVDASGNPVPVTEQFRDQEGNVLGTYTLTVRQITALSRYAVRSEGVTSSGTARRVVSGTITKTTKKTIPPYTAYYNTTTVYDP